MTTPWFKRLSEGLSQEPRAPRRAAQRPARPRARPRRGVLERPRGHPHRRRHGLRRHHRHRRRDCADEAAREGAARRRGGHRRPRRPDRGRVPGRRRGLPRALTGHRADGRRQRHRQDDDGRQARQAGRRKAGAASCSASADTFRAAASEQLDVWAERAQRAGRRAATAAPILQPWPSTRSSRPRRPAPTSRSSTPPAGFTPPPTSCGSSRRCVRVDREPQQAAR